MHLLASNITSNTARGTMLLVDGASECVFHPWDWGSR